MSLSIQNRNKEEFKIPLETMHNDYFRHIHQYLDPQSRANLASTSKSMCEREICIRNQEQYGAIKRLIVEIIDHLPPGRFSKVTKELSQLNRGLDVNSNWCAPLLREDIESLKDDLIHILTKVYDNKVVRDLERNIKLPANCKDIFRIAEGFKELRRSIKGSHESAHIVHRISAYHAFFDLVKLGKMEQALQILVQADDQDLLFFIASRLLEREQNKIIIPVILSIIKYVKPETPAIDADWFLAGIGFILPNPPHNFVILDNLMEFCLEDKLWSEAIEAANLYPSGGQICFASISLQRLAMFLCNAATEEYEFAIQAAESIPNRSIRIETLDYMIADSWQWSFATSEEIDRLKDARRACSQMPSCIIL